MLTGTIVFFAIDPDALGRVDHASLPQETLMELLLNNPNDRRFTDSQGTLKTPCDWRGVHCNENGEISQIVWRGQRAGFLRRQRTFERPIHLRWIPSTIEKLVVYDWRAENFDPVYLPDKMQSLTLRKCNLKGTMEARNLPRSLLSIDLTQNAVSGTINARDLPLNLCKIELSKNALTGSVNLEDLPRNLVEVSFSHNQMTGTLNCINLPLNLKRLSLCHNQFFGVVDLLSLPDHLIRLALDHNKLSGPIDLRINCDYRVNDSADGMFIHNNKFQGAIRCAGNQTVEGTVNLRIDNVDKDGIKTTIMPSIELYCADNEYSSIDWCTMTLIRNLNACRNALKGSLDVKQIPPFLKYLDFSENQISGSVDLTAFIENPDGIREFRASKNKFCGTVNFRKLPANLKLLDISENALSGTVTFGCVMPNSIYLNDNRFVEFNSEEKFPANMREIYLDGNCIESKALRLNRLPQYCDFLDLRRNNITKLLDCNASLNRDKRIMYDRKGKAH